MRLILLTLFLIAAVDGGIVDKVKGVFSGEGSFGQKLKNATIVGFKKLFENTALFKIRDKIRSMKDKVLKTLELTPKMMKSLEERLKRLRPIKKDKVAEKGDSITEVNEYSQVGQDLYQSDMVLTEEQAEEIVQDIEDEVAGENRAKRQAFKDHRYPNMLWSEGVNYYFHKLASMCKNVALVGNGQNTNNVIIEGRQMRSSFEKGAKLWEQDTCINFTRNPFAKDRIMVFPEDGCWSYVGKLGGEQKLSLGRGCETVSIAAHELGHALGFFPYNVPTRSEMRNTRNRGEWYFQVDWLSQFNKETTKTNDNYNMTYDYGSIMHYGGTSASFNKKPTMVPFDIDYQQTLGSPFISFIELSMLNEHYGCKGLTASFKTPFHRYRVRRC
ncbi:astacin [Cooperia oncophora]